MNSPCNNILEEYKSCIKNIHISEININRCLLIWNSLLKCYKDLENNNNNNLNEQFRGKYSKK
jgi:hypothetical protein